MYIFKNTKVTRGAVSREKHSRGKHIIVKSISWENFLKERISIFTLLPQDPCAS